MPDDAKDYQYVVVTNYHKKTPIVKDTPEAAAEEATKKYNLEYDALDIANWDSVGLVTPPNRWVFATAVHDWEYVSIHRIEKE